MRWFAAAWLLRQAGKTSWEQVDAHDIEQWMVQLLDRYSSAYTSIQFRRCGSCSSGGPVRNGPPTR